MDLTPLLAARMQMALTLGFHIVIACLGMGLPVLLLFAEWRFLRTNDTGWRTLARRWSRAFAVIFAVGAVTGTVLSFEFGILWPGFLGTFGSVIGLPFTLEGFAFFLEAIFVGIYVYSWDRLPPWVHWWSGVPIAIAGFASAWFVVTANAWMNVPQGFQMQNGVVIDADPWAAMLNPATGPQTTHMIVAAYMVTGFLVATYYAVAWLRGSNTLYVRRAMAVGLGLGVIFAPIQPVIGDWAATTVAQTQPVKLASMEGQFQTEAHAPLRIGGIPIQSQHQTRYALEIPGLLSWLAYRNTNAVVKGLDSFPQDQIPPVAPVHLAFQAMVGIGFALIGLTLWCLWGLWRRRGFPRGRPFLWAVAVSGPLATLALEAGWVVTEVGRQPWIVHGILLTRDAVTHATGIVWLLPATVIVYTAITVGTITVLRLLARRPLNEDPHDS